MSGMKLYEHLLGTGPVLCARGGGKNREVTEFHISQLRESLRAGATAVDVSNVADYYASHSQSMWYYAKDFPNLLSPFQCSFLEYRNPRVWRNMANGTKEETVSEDMSVGTMVFTLDKRNPDQAVMWEKDSRLRDFGGQVDHDRFERAMEMCFWMRVRDKVIFVGIEFLFALAWDGSFLCANVTSPFFSLEEIEEATASFVSTTHITLLAHSFMHCKNIRLEDTVPRETRIINHRRVTSIKKGIKYKVLNIDPMKEILRREGGSDRHGVRKAMHICRGHFATYTTSIFGRPLEEPVTVWRPQHTRGSTEMGTIKKSYKIK